MPKATLGAVAPQKNRHEKRGEERAEIDDPVERIEHHLGAVLVGLVELVADERRHARLDAARAERDEREAGVETGAVRSSKSARQAWPRQ